MELHYHWTREDISADIAWFVKKDAEVARKIRRSTTIPAAILVTTGVLIAGLSASPSGIWLILLGIVFLFAYPVLLRARLKSVRKQSYDRVPGDVLFGPRALTVSEDTLSFQTGEKTTTIPRSEIVCVVNAPHAIYLTFRDGTPAMIPAHAFRDGQREAFLSEIQEKPNPS